VRRGTTTPLWAALTAVSLLAACSGDEAPEQAPAASSARESGETTRQAQDPGTSAPEAEESGPACEVDLPATWQTALEEGSVVSPDGGERTLHRVLADGTQVVRIGPDAARSELVWQGPDGEERTIQQIGQLDWYARVPGVHSDGRYVAWSLVQWADTEDETTRVFVWDSANEGPPLELAEGDVVGSPVVLGGAVVWVQGSGDPMDLSGLHAFDLASATARVLEAGYLRAPVAVGDVVLAVDQAPEGTAGRDPRVVAVPPAGTNPAVPAEESPAVGGDLAGATTAGPLDQPSGSPPEVEQPTAVEELPEALTAPEESLGALAAGEDVVAWTDADGDGILVWQVGTDEPWQAVELPPRSDGVTHLSVAGGVVAWSLPDEGRYVLDPEAGSYARISEASGPLRSVGDQLLLGPAEDGLGLPPVLIDPSSLSELPGCGPDDR
jgi:hypothetical protein